MPSPIRLGLIGCGVVGSGLLRLLRQRARDVESSIGAPIRVSRIAVADPAKRRDVDLAGVEVGKDAMAVAEAEDVDLLVELMGGAARSLPPVERALERGLPVVTANKHLISLHGAQLESLAARTGATLRYEASVGGVIPILQSLDHTLRTERFTLLSPNHIWYEATLDDPQTYTRPWTIEMPLYRMIDQQAQLLEHKCVPFADGLLYQDLIKNVQPR